jgi:hypothetical protein
MNEPSTPEVGWQDVLNAARRNFGPTPRQFGWLRRIALRLPRPRWFRVGESFPALEQIFARQNELWHNGEIVWGAVLQATDALFEKGIDDLPAVVLYSFDPQCERNLLGLAQAAKQVASMAANVNLSDPEQVQRMSRGGDARHLEGAPSVEPVTKFLPIVAGLNILNVNEVPTASSPRAKLQAELAAPIRYEIPLALTSMVPMIATTVLVRRLHLPARRLTNGYLPLVVDRQTGAAAILPSRYWPREVLEDWQRANVPS